MNQKLYSILRLTLGLFILLAALEAGNTLTNHYWQTIKTITTHSIAKLQKQQEPLQLVISYCSQLIDSSKNRLS
ncbi:hypothetical protein KRR40_06830 [Niabella defluvii]|jgi:hypothetical protein|nr:hypothetical protein KRR40_06830 [Niabella sp. I65]